MKLRVKAFPFQDYWFEPLSGNRRIIFDGELNNEARVV